MERALMRNGGWTALALAVAVVIPAAGRASEAERPQSYLLSLDGIALGRDEFVDGFSIDTWDVGIVAVCHIPPGWQITAGKTAALDGVLKGQASHGVTYLSRAGLHALHEVALVTLRGPVRRAAVGSAAGTRPATFAGRTSVGRYGSDARRSIALTAANVRLLPALRCPPPQP